MLFYPAPIAVRYKSLVVALETNDLCSFVFIAVCVFSLQTWKGRAHD